MIAPSRSTGSRGGVGAILIVLALGLAFRLIIAYLLQTTGSGFGVDLASFRGWAANLAAEGPFGFYERPFFHDYTPGYLYVLWLVGLVAQWLGGGVGDLIKIPPVLTDLALGWLVWSMVRELGGRDRWALLGAVLVVFNPVSWFDSIVWGQVDSFGLVFLLLGVRELMRDRPERAAIWTVVAALIKPQLGILIPLVAVVTIRRALWPVDPAARDPETPWERRTGHPIRILTTGLAGFLTALAMSIPFGLSVIEPTSQPPYVASDLLYQVLLTASRYAYLSVNAYNPWALASLDGTGVAANGVWVCDVVLPASPTGPDCPEAFMIGAVPAVVVGTALLVLAFVVTCAVIARRPDPLTILVGLAVLAVAFFILPTRVHERYMFPMVAIGAILAAISWRWLIAYVLLSLATFLNMYVVLTTIYTGNPGIADWLAIGPWIRSTGGVMFVVALNTVAAIWVFLQLRPAARRELERELELVSDRPPDDEYGPADTMPGIWPGTAPGAAASAVMMTSSPASLPPATAATASVAVSLPSWGYRPSITEAGPIGWFMTRLHDRPVRPDRSRTLHGESGGRLDRMDVWLLIVLMISVFGLRLFRLAEPYQMHFDEVYHARTATEFLQYWRYGMSNNIYEWTHPHLAKYAMAGGLALWGEDEVSAQSELGVPVRDALIEPRRDDPTLAGGRGGDRLHLVTGSELRSYDLARRELLATTSVPGATALALDQGLERLYIGTDGGEILSVDVGTFDTARDLETTALLADPQAFAQLDGSIERLYATSDGTTVFAVLDGVDPADQQLVALDATTAEELGRVTLPAVADFAPGGTGPAVVASEGSVLEPAETAAELAGLLGGSAADYEARLSGSGSSTIVAGIENAADRTAVEAAITDGRLAGLSVEDVARVAVATGTGVTFVAAADGTILASVPTDGGATGLAFISDLDDPKLYVATGGSSEAGPGQLAVLTIGGTPAADGPVLSRTIPMPGAVSRVVYDDASQMVHALGETPDGTGWTIYVVEPHDQAVFADARLPFEPAAWVADVAARYPSEDRQQILAFDADGSMASVEVGRHAFAWRLPGIIAGSLMAGALYLLARLLFRRRSVALFVGLIALLDGMLFVQSRIGMNDVYVGLFIILAYLPFAALWLGRWRWRGAFWLVMPVVGVLLGLALASKWVALYAIGALGLLWLARSALGRILIVAGLIGITAVLGGQALTSPPVGTFGNLPFVAIMCALTLAATAIAVLHPLAWSFDEMRAAVGAPAVLGALVAGAAFASGTANTVIAGQSVTPITIALALFATALAAFAILVFAGRVGFGPLAPEPDPSDPEADLPPADPAPAADWLRPGAMLGLPVVWLGICLVAVPLAVYIASYLPWAFIDNHRITDTWPVGHTGQTLLGLTGEMYRYHDGLSAAHAASAPWWAWLFNLKPTWFYQDGLAGGTTGAIYNAGNLVVWWLGVPAMAFAAWQAYQRRSLALALIVIGFACQWLPWARIDRAAFQYHYYTSLPFLALGLAYFLAEIWHGASRRTWLFVRLAAAVAIVGPILLWLFIRPLCAIVGVERASPGSQACIAQIPQFVLTWRALGIAVAVGIGLIVLLRLASSLARRPAEGDGGGGDAAYDGAGFAWARSIGIAAAVAVGVALVVGFLPNDPILAWSNVPVEPVALLLGLPLILVAAFVATARDAHRFVQGAIVAIVAWFLLVYPNISALPLPSAFHNTYQGILPTYLYAFQFPVATERTAPTPLIGPVPLVLAAVLTLTVIVVGYSAWIWRLALAERDASSRSPGRYGTGDAGMVGGSGA